jgi:hypothetical protein
MSTKAPTGSNDTTVATNLNFSGDLSISLQWHKNVSLLDDDVDFNHGYIKIFEIWSSGTPYTPSTTSITESSTEVIIDTALQINNELNLGTNNPGTSGQVLVSAGPGNLPTWSAPSTAPGVYGRCLLSADQNAPDQSAGTGGVIVENWVAESWSVGFSVGGTNNREISVTTAGVYRYDLTMLGTYGGSTNNGVEFQLRDGAGNDLVCWASYNGEGNRFTGSISGLLNVTNASAGFRVYGYMNAGGTGYWSSALHGPGCSLSLQLVA